MTTIGKEQESKHFPLAPDAASGEIGRKITNMLDDKALHKASRSFGSGVSRFGEPAHAAELIEQAV